MTPIHPEPAGAALAAIRHEQIKTHDPARGRPVWIDVWRPAQVMGTGPALVLSHGAFGAAGNYAWLARHLAGHGYLVAGVCHFGESFVYGANTVDPTAAARPDDRPRDGSFALDVLCSTPPYRALVDPQRIGVIGHSSGGATAIALAGGRLDPAAMARYCASADRDADKGCAYARPVSEAGASSAPSPTPPAARDPRVRAVVALDPALGPGFDAASLASIAVPVHVVAAVDNDFLPFEAHADRLARLIPRASLTRLDRGEGHFVFLNQSDVDLEVHGVPLYRDRAGVDRGRVHARVAAIVRGFFDTHLRKE